MLARHHHRFIKASEADIARVLTGNWRKEHLLMLKQALGMNDDIGRHLAECDARLDASLHERAAAKVDFGPLPCAGSKARAEHDVRQRLVFNCVN